MDDKQPEEVDWFKEGQIQFVMSKTHPEKPPARYPTQDKYTPQNEADYIAGFNVQKAAWGSGEGFGAFEGYAHENEEGKKK
jgi:hypothetical protein